jgi:hypothetical protein
VCEELLAVEICDRIDQVEDMMRETKESSRDEEKRMLRRISSKFK